MTQDTGTVLRADRDELAEAVAAECDKLADRWWDDRDSYRYAKEHDPDWKEPSIWLSESRPPMRTVGEVLAYLLREFDAGEAVPVVDVLERFHGAYERHEQRGERRLAHGFYRASKAIREASGLGYPEPDPILGRCP